MAEEGQLCISAKSLGALALPEFCPRRFRLGCRPSISSRTSA